MNYHPDDIETHVAVTMDETVAHVRDIAPRNFGMGDPRRFRDLARRLADDFQRSNGGVLVQAARQEG